MSDFYDIVIVGAGIAGLTTALGLAQNGISAHILEAFEAPSEIGAGIQIPPNATHILRQLDLFDTVREHAVAPDAIRLRDGQSGHELLCMPVNGPDDTLQDMMTVHRAVLHAALYQAASANPLITIFNGQQVESVRAEDEGVVVVARTVNGVAEYAVHTLIGADGIWSKVRSALGAGVIPQQTGRIALRAIAPLPTDADADAGITAYLAPAAHLVSYPIRNSDTRNLVAIIKGRADDNSWSAAVPDAILKQLVAQFSGCGLAPIFQQTRWTAWPLAHIAVDAPWHNGKNTVLIGDAAHALEPFAAQGAAMALEDGYVLAQALCADNLNVSAAFSAYEATRRPRIAAVRQRTDFNRKIYHLAGPARLARNLALRVRRTQSFIKDLDWLYQYRA